MASSGSFNSTAHNGGSGTRYLTFSWKEVSQNVSTNKTTISWELKGAGTSTQWFALRDVKLVIAGETVYTVGGDYYNFIKLDQGTVVASGTHTFTHNADGTKSFSVSMEAAIYVYTVNVSGSSTFTLDTIARASQPSLVTWPNSTQNVGDFGATFSIHMNRKSDSFTHTVRYEYGSRTGTIATKVATGTTWAVPLSFINDIPSATSASGRIYVDTYNGSTLVGTKYTGFTVTVPASVKPTCSITLDDTTGVDNTYGSPVRGLSKIKVTVSATQAYSSPIASYSISVNGATYNTATATTGVLINSGSVPVNVTVTDERGRTGSASYTMNVQDYTAPAVSMLTVKRCNSDGTENAQGEYCQLAFNAVISSMGSKNTATYTYGYKKSTASSWTTGTLSGLSNKYSVSNSTYIFKADSNASYDVRIVAKDRHGSTTRTTSVSTAFTILNWHESGTGFAVGKVSEAENTFEVGISADFQGAVYGQAFGLGELPSIPTSANFNNYLTPGCYAVYLNATAETISNIPVKLAGRLYVSLSNGFDGGGANLYLEQKYVPFDYGVCTRHTPAWVRYIEKGTSAALTITSWFNEAIKAYPVGSIYLAYNHTSPASLFGGTWTRITEAFLWATSSGGTIGQTGGESEHTLTASEIPSHSHTVAVAHTTTGGTAAANIIRYNSDATSYLGSIGTTSTGGGESHNNMPPYIQVAVWRRTA